LALAINILVNYNVSHVVTSPTIFKDSFLVDPFLGLDFQLFVFVFWSWRFNGIAWYTVCRRSNLYCGLFLWWAIIKAASFKNLVEKYMFQYIAEARTEGKYMYLSFKITW